MAKLDRIQAETQTERRKESLVEETKNELNSESKLSTIQFTL